MEVNKLLPAEILKILDQMRKNDMADYIESESGKLKKTISIEVTACPVCRHKERSLLFQKEAFEFHQCEKCSLVYVSPRLNDEYLGRLYDSGRSAYQTKKLYLPTAEYRKEHIYRRKASELIKLVPTGRLLDYGSSTGYFLQSAIEVGWDGYGLELNPFGVKWAREKLGLSNVYDKPIEDCGFEKETFDVITLWDVLEHVPDPLDLLLELKPYLKPDGCIVIETSHYDCFETEFLGAENTNIVGDIHLMYFTSESLNELSSKAGYELTHKEIFGLDLNHIINYNLLNGLPEIVIPPDLINSLQELIDVAGKGCYIKAILKKNGK
ncbi:class I SAM-dependent methyltransferase [Thermodesulfobacteriota bacterium]